MILLLPAVGLPAFKLGTTVWKFIADYFAGGLLSYLEGVGITPSQSVEIAPAAGNSSPHGGIDPALLEELWQKGDGAGCGLDLNECHLILLRVGAAQNYGLPLGAVASRRQQSEFFHALRLNDLLLARACAQGNERAWERFFALYRQPLLRAAIAIAGSDTMGRDLAGALYAELYGLKTLDGERRCPLESYRGRGSLIGWLRTTLAQRHVDHHRRSHRELPLDDPRNSLDPPALEPEAATPPAELETLGKAIQAALVPLQPEERFVLAAYYVDGRTLAQIAPVLGVHEATISRKLHRAIMGIRKRILKHLQGFGLSRRAAEEALGTDPRDLNLNLKKLLQAPASDAFQEKAAR